MQTSTSFHSALAANVSSANFFLPLPLTQLLFPFHRLLPPLNFNRFPIHLTVDTAMRNVRGKEADRNPSLPMITRESVRVQVPLLQHIQFRI